MSNFYNEYPYTDIHELNLDWILKTMRELEEKVANIKEDKTVNFIAKSSCSVHAGMIVKSASNQADGNGGGSPTFAQGGGRNTKSLKDILNYVEKSLNDAE